ncbi:TrkH family potassium uptake protein [Polyangium spumosum]|nr:potassium transporter TrkG [Polyangium spumosum]
MAAPVPSPGAGAAIVAPRPPVRWAAPATLLTGSAVLLGVDLALAVSPTLSVVLTAIETLLVPAWLAAVIKKERQAGRRGAIPAASTKPRWGAYVVLLVLLLACIAEKWLLFRHPAGGDDPHLVALYRTYTVLAFVLANGSLLGRRPLERLLVSTMDHPARLMLLSFGLAAVLGAFLLTLPQAVHDIAHTSFVDGLFMATSAICVTGLAVHNVADVYTPLGQVILLLLFQVGGLGIMVLSTFFVIVAGRKIHLRDAAVMAEMIDAESFSKLRRSVAAIVAYTLIVEAIGAAALYATFRHYPDIATPAGAGAPLSGAGDHLWAAVFHAVSAYCSAGFSLFREGMAPLVSSVPASGVVMVLIVIGGLGYPVHDELVRWVVVRVRGGRPPRLSLHTRTVLVTSAVLIVSGLVGFLVLEGGRSMRELSWPTRVLAALHQSITTRSAGFSTVDFGAMSSATWMMTCVLMFIGAAPGSTGGGVKVTTVAVLFATLRAELRGFEAPRLLGRTVPAALVRRAMGVAFLSVLLVAGFLFLLLLVEPHDPFAIVFETVSAFATVGLSTGITSSLSTPGRLLVAVIMFIGRIGPLTLALALANQSGARGFRLPEERVGIG